MAKRIMIKPNARGLAVGEFVDRYGQGCSIQKSSLATEDCIWLGVDDAKPKVMASRAREFGVSTDETTGWVDYPIPEGVLLHTRMHLTRKQVKALLPILENFALTGEL